MKFAELFGRATARWVKYSEYDAAKGKDGEWYIAPVKGAVQSVYDPIENAEAMVVDALNVGLKCLSGAYEDERIVAEICVFAEKYGLLGFIAALPTTPEFMEYETVYLPKNRYIRKESMPSKEYAKLFFPFDDTLNDKPNPYKHYKKADGSIMVSLAARNKPIAVEMCYQPNYAESCEWLITQFKDWAVIFGSSFLHYETADTVSLTTLYDRKVSA